jgi:hypothetical protein
MKRSILMTDERRRLWVMRLTVEQLAETIDGEEVTYWHLHGFRTGRCDEFHKPPPIWQWRNWQAWRQGWREGISF